MTLPEFFDKYQQVYNTKTKGTELRRKNRAEGSASLSETIDLIGSLLKSYQMTYLPHNNDKNLLWFPFMFIQPLEGDKIINTATKEILIVDQVIRDPATKRWDGILRLDARNQPSYTKRHSLRHLNEDRYVRFDHETPTTLPNLVGANVQEYLKNAPPMIPTVTWTVERTEPGGYSSPFGPRKELKPSLRETVKDPINPGYTVAIYGQSFDSIVQFDCWSTDHRSSDLLVNWVEQFFKYYVGVLRQLGLSQAFFWKREKDSVQAGWRQYYPTRGTQYYFRTEQLEAVYNRDILKIDVNIETQSTMSGNLSNPRYIADQYVSGNFNYRDLFYRSGEYLFGELDILE